MHESLVVSGSLRRTFPTAHGFENGVLGRCWSDHLHLQVHEGEIKRPVIWDTWNVNVERLGLFRAVWRRCCGSLLGTFGWLSAMPGNRRAEPCWARPMQDEYNIDYRFVR